MNVQAWVVRSLGWHLCQRFSGGIRQLLRRTRLLVWIAVAGRTLPVQEAVHLRSTLASFSSLVPTQSHLAYPRTFAPLPLLERFFVVAITRSLYFGVVVSLSVSVWKKTLKTASNCCFISCLRKRVQLASTAPHIHCHHHRHIVVIKRKLLKKTTDTILLWRTFWPLCRHARCRILPNIM